MPVCLVIMPFRDELKPHFELIEHCGKELGLEVRRADTYGYSGLILRAISKALSEADLIVADLSYANANVLYEVAIAHCLGKKVLLITNDRNTVPFDLATYRVELLEPASANQAEQLCRAMRLVFEATYIVGPLGGTVIFGQKVFFRRAVAFLVDIIPFVLIPLGLTLRLASSPDRASMLAISGSLSFFAFLLYGAVTTCTLGGTVGQWILGLKVVTMEGDRASFLRALGRSATSVFLSGFTYGIGFLWCLRSPGFRTFHDIASQTMVVRRGSLAMSKE
jgi:uncharacterized RDD family membrane protein YckC